MGSMPTFEKWLNTALPLIKPYAKALAGGALFPLALWIALKYLSYRKVNDDQVIVPSIIAYYLGVLVLTFCFARAEVKPGRFAYIRSGIVPVIPMILIETILGITAIMGYSPNDRPAAPETIPGTIIALIFFTFPLPFLAGVGAFLRNEYRILFKG